jgi:NTE family protein
LIRCAQRLRDRRVLPLRLTVAIVITACLQASARAEDNGPGLVTPYDATPTVLTAPPPTTPTPNRRPKIGLALGGGGTRGAAHIGVLRVLVKEGIPFDMIVGTSMGSVVGGLYCAGLTVDEIEDRFQHGLMKSFLTVPIPVRIAVIPIFYIPRLFGYKPYDGFYVGGKFRNFINDSVPADRRLIQNLKTPFGAVALNLLNGQAYCITRGDLGHALQASGAIPVLRRPVKTEDGLFVDGGVVANLPVTETRALGAQLVIAVDVDERFEPKPDKAFRKIGSVAGRVLTLHLAKVDESQVKDADVVIHPNVNGISLVSTKRKNINDAILAGEEAARQAIPELRAKLGLPAKERPVGFDLISN